MKELNAYFVPGSFVIDEAENQPADTFRTWFEAFEADKKAKPAVRN